MRQTCTARRAGRDAISCFARAAASAALALAYLLNQDTAARRRRRAVGCMRGARPIGFNPYAPKAPHFKPRATAVISLFMSGGVSHVDTFDPKPALIKYAGQPLDGKVAGDVIVRQGHPGSADAEPVRVQELRTERDGSVRSVSARRRTRRRHRVRPIGVRPVERPRAGDLRNADRAGPHGFPEPRIVGHLRTRIGEREPAGVRGDSGRRGGPLGGVNDWSSGFIPAAYQGTLFRSTGDPIVDLKPPSEVEHRAAARAARSAGEAERARHAAVSRQLGSGGAHLVLRARVPDAGLRARSARRRARESDATRKLYGLDDKITEPFGRQCLMARRLVEHGVRFVQLFHGGMGNQNTDTWDAHGDVKANHSQHAAESDLPDRRLARRI